MQTRWKYLSSEGICSKILFIFQTLSAEFYNFTYNLIQKEFSGISFTGIYLVMESTL